MSVSLDGCRPQTHDGVRGIAGHLEMTIAAIGQLVAAGVTVQINTTVMEQNAADLPGVAALLARRRAHLGGLLPDVGRPGDRGSAAVPHDGQVYPAGFLPLGLGSIRTRPLREIYTSDPLLQSIRAAKFTGRCGACEYADLCGGSRARAYAATGDPLGPDPVCPYQPADQPITGL